MLQSCSNPWPFWVKVWSSTCGSKILPRPPATFWFAGWPNRSLNFVIKIFLLVQKAVQGQIGGGQVGKRPTSRPDSQNQISKNFPP